MICSIKGKGPNKSKLQLKTFVGQIDFGDVTVDIVLESGVFSVVVPLVELLGAVQGSWEIYTARKEVQSVGKGEE